MNNPLKALNGGWKNWLLGIGATVIATMIGNDIIFQRDTRATLTKNDERLKIIELQRLPIAREQIVREFKRQEDRVDKIVQVIDNMYNTRITPADFERELRQRDQAIERLERRLEQLEKK